MADIGTGRGGRRVATIHQQSVWCRISSRVRSTLGHARLSSFSAWRSPSPRPPAWVSELPGSTSSASFCWSRWRDGAHWQAHASRPLETATTVLLAALALGLASSAFALRPKLLRSSVGLLRDGGSDLSARSRRSSTVDTTAASWPPSFGAYVAGVMANYVSALLLGFPSAQRPCLSVQQSKVSRAVAGTNDSPASTGDAEGTLKLLARWLGRRRRIVVDVLHRLRLSNGWIAIGWLRSRFLLRFRRRRWLKCKLVFALSARCCGPSCSMRYRHCCPFRRCQRLAALRTSRQWMHAGTVATQHRCSACPSASRPWPDALLLHRQRPERAPAQLLAPACRGVGCQRPIDRLCGPRARRRPLAFREAGDRTSSRRVGVAVLAAVVAWASARCPTGTWSSRRAKPCPQPC